MVSQFTKCVSTTKSNAWMVHPYITFRCRFLFFEIEEFIIYAGKGATIQTSAFLSGFFVLLGTHGAHVTGGIIWAICVIIQILKRGLTPVTARKVFIISLYWHFLDFVWIFIYTLVYLNGMVA